MTLNLALFFHILCAIVAVGLNTSYTVWLVRARRDPTLIQFALKGVKFLDDYIANPAYALLLVSGLGMAIFGGVGFPRWIISALVLYGLMVVLAFGGYSPALRGQIRALAAGGVTSEEYLRQERRGTVTGIIIGVIVLVILALMVFKPAF